jgi:S1-C subfamily serine protease
LYPPQVHGTRRHLAVAASLTLGALTLAAASAVSPYRFQEVFRANEAAVLRLRSDTAAGAIFTTAFLVRDDGTMLTADRAVRGARSVQVVDPTGGALPCQLLRHDPALGVAILRAPSAGLLPTVQIGEAAKVRHGDWVVGIGHDDRGVASARAGCISRVFRSKAAGHPRHFVIDAATSEGGPVLDLRGQVVAIALRPEGSRRAQALSIDELRPLLRELASASPTPPTAEVRP